MLGKEPRPRTIVSVNIRLAYACLLLLYGWACWQWTSKEWWGLGLVAILAFTGGAIQIIATIHQVVAMIGRDRKLDDFASQGSPSRGDRLANERDLKDRGMIR